MRKSLILAAGILLLSLPACKKTPQGFPGKYEVEGFEYFAILNIARAGQGYNLEWKLSDESSVYGIGVERDSMLAVVQASDPVKIMAYRKEGKSLTGIWVTPDMEGLKFERTEDAKRLKHSKHDLSGTYAVTGTYPDGTLYQGTLTLTKTDFTHIARWDIEDEEGEEPYFGIGFTVDSFAVVGYGGVNRVGVVMFAIQDSVLEGVSVSADPAELNKQTQVSTGTQKAVLVSKPEPEESEE